MRKKHKKKRWVVSWVVSWVVKLEKKKTKIDVLMCVNVYRNDIKCLESDHIKTLLIGFKTKKQ